MKTIVHIELTDEQRSRLADLIDGKGSKRLATRKEVVALVTGLAQHAADLPLDRREPVARVGGTGGRAPSKSQLKSPLPKWRYFQLLSEHLESEGNTVGSQVAHQAYLETRP